MNNNLAQNAFPVDMAIPKLRATLAAHGRAILTATPGSGKTTRVPLALLGLLPKIENHDSVCTPLTGKILVLEPRRLAARAAARYMAELLGENIGHRVGYRVRLESRVSNATRVELLTEGMFTRLLLADPSLSGVSCVIFDEYHERSLQADLGLALCLECVEAFRPDLRLLIMSATLETEALSRFLGNCPIIEVKGRSWPVETRYASPKQSITPASFPEDVAVQTATAIHETLRCEYGSILAFLPGWIEIKRTAELLEKLPNDTDIYLLHGDLSAREQDAAIAPSPPGRRKVVLATDLAQTSLTIEGVRIVIDAGLVRTPRFDPSTGLSKLVTTRLTRDAADQRAGRAGRLEPGICLRLWPEKEHLSPQARPEIMDADLAPLFLEALMWGSNPASLPWLTPPPQLALTYASETLLTLEAIRPNPGISNTFTLTEHGQKLARLPMHPRLAHMVLRAADMERDLSSLAACLAALVSERDPLRTRPVHNPGADIRLRLPLLRQPENKRLKEAAAQIYRLAGPKSKFTLPAPGDEEYAGMLLSLAWPERVAQQRCPGSFRLASGQGAELPECDPLAAAPWLVATNLGNGVNRRIFLAAPVALADLLHLHKKKIRIEEEIFWDPRTEAVICRAAKRFGALIFEKKNLTLSPERNTKILKALLEGIIALGLECLPWTDELRQLQARVVMLRNLEDAAGTKRNPWPDLRDDTLMHNLTAGLSDKPESTWLSPWLEGISRRAQFSGIDLRAALHSLLSWPLPERLEHDAPQRLHLPSGSSAKIDYMPVLRGEQPVLAVKLQEMFGQADTPRLANGRIVVMVHLLSPAGRALQVTSDLRHFWDNAYKQVRAEMRGRYPKHPWPEDPLSALPTSKTKKKLLHEGTCR